MRRIYLDHAAATPTDRKVLQAMRPYFDDTFANPSSFHSAGLRAREAVTKAREIISEHLNCSAAEVLFVSGGTESDNLALFGIVRTFSIQHSALSTPSHVITSAVEHHAVLEPLKHLQKTGGIDLTILPVDKYGRVDVKELQKNLRPDTILVSLMFANNEIGTVFPIAEIGKTILKWRKKNKTAFPYFHTDACQAAGVYDLDVEKLHVDALSFSGSKIYGPKGVGCLYLRRGVLLSPLFFGGGQERGLRSGTENVPGIVGLAKALQISFASREKENARLAVLRDRLVEGLLAIPKTRLNGHPTERLPNNVNVSFLDIEGEAAVLYLDAKGIYCSTGSACASASLDPSHVILATGLSYEAAHGSLRFSLGRDTTSKDIDYVIGVLPDIVKKLRAMSPVKLDMKYFA